MVIIKYGALLTSTAQAIGHGCNCKGVMGAGMAAVIKKAFPHSFQVYAQACATGDFSPGDAIFVPEPSVWICHLAIQRSYGRPPWRGGKPRARIEWVRAALIKAKAMAMEKHIDHWAFSDLGCRNGGLYFNLEDYERKLADSSPEYRHRLGLPPPPSETVEGAFREIFAAAPLRVEVWRPAP